MLLVLSFNSKISKTILAQKDSPNTSLRLNQIVYFVDLYLKISKTIFDQTSGPKKNPILKIQKPYLFSRYTAGTYLRTSQKSLNPYLGHEFWSTLKLALIVSDW